jgi:membrane protease YdiL (CAAX protease family)
MDITTALPLEQKSELKTLKPMGWVESILMFGIPAAAYAAGMLWLRPALMSLGMTIGNAHFIAMALLNGGLLAAAVIGYLQEGNPLTWSGFARRMRLTRMSGRTWLWALLGTVFLLLLSLAVNLVAVPLFKAINFALPSQPLGNRPLWMIVTSLFLNIVGEELWWRGYIFPRQELTFGKKTFLVQGILWPFFHIVRWYEVPFMMMTQWVIPFVAQRTKNTWPGIISHTCLNSASPLLEIIFKALKLI